MTDPAWAKWIDANLPWLHMHIGSFEFSWVQVVGAALVVLVGKQLAKKHVNTG